MKKKQKWGYITPPQHFMQEYSVFSLPLPHPSRETHSCLVNFDMGLSQRFHPEVTQVVLTYAGLPALEQEYLYWRKLKFEMLEMNLFTETSPLCSEKRILCCISWGLTWPSAYHVFTFKKYMLTNFEGSYSGQEFLWYQNKNSRKKPLHFHCSGLSSQMCLNLENKLSLVLEVQWKYVVLHVLILSSFHPRLR